MVILLKIKLVQFTRPVWHIALQLAGIDQEIHGKNFFRKLRLSIFTFRIDS